MPPHYRATFVLPGVWSHGRLPGGYVVVFQLAQVLARKNEPCAVVFLKDAMAAFDGKFGFSPLEGPAKRELIEKASNDGGAFADWSLLDGVDLYQAAGVPPRGAFKTDWVFATAFTTASLAATWAEVHGIRGGYLVQNFEADESFSGPVANRAMSTYTLPLTKFTVSRKIQEMFSEAHLFHPAIGSAYRHAGVGGNRPPSVLVPLSSMGYKGAGFALEVIARLKGKVAVHTYSTLPHFLIPSWVQHHGTPSDAELAELHRQVKVFFLPSQMEGFPVPLLEGLASGNLVVTSDRHGAELPDTVRQVAYGDVEKAVEAIENFASLNVSEERLRKDAEWAIGFTLKRMGEEFREGLADAEEESTAPSEAVRRTIEQYLDFHYKWDRRTWKNTRWLGTPIWKMPSDLFVYQDLIWKIRPRAIVETGSAKGGSALFFASMLDLLHGPTGQGVVVSVDIEAEDPDEPRAKHPRITYLHGSSTEPSVVAKVQELVGPFEPRMVVCDSDHSDVHTLKELELYSPLVAKDSYIIMEDSNIGRSIHTLAGGGPWQAISRFVKAHPEFVSDRGVEPPITQNPRGFLRRIA